MCRDEERACYVSSGLEDVYSHNEARRVLSFTKRAFPWATGYVRNPVFPVRDRGVLIERHGRVRCTGKVQVSSNDGTEMPGIELRTRARRYAGECFAWFMWKGKWQGIGRRFVRPRDRRFVFDANDILLIRRSYR